MASTISNNTLTVLIRESVELGGKNRGADHTLSISNINEIDNRIVTALSSSEQSLFKLSNNVAAGTFVTSSMKYARITNKDDTYPIRIRISSSQSHTDFQVAAGGSFMLTTSKNSGSMVGASNYQTYNDISDVLVQATGSNVDVEYFIASR